MILAILACPAMGQRYRQMQLVIVDEFGDPVTNIDQIEIYDAGTVDVKTLYTNRAGAAEIENPITTATTNSTFVQSLGLVTWFQAAASYRVTIIEDGASQSLTIDNMTSSDTRFPFYANYIGAAAALTVADDALLKIGTSGNFLHDWATPLYIIYPSGDGGKMHFGKNDLHTDIYFHAGDTTTDYVFFDEGSLNLQLIDIDLLIDDESKLFFGDSSDVTIEYDEGNEDLDILSTTALDEISFGANSDSYDVIWHASTAATNVLFDYDADELLLTLADLKISQGSQIEFIDVSDALTDWTIDNATDNVLLFTCTETDESPKFHIGVASAGADLKVFGTDAGDYIEWDASADLFTIVGDEVALTLSGAGTNAFDLNCSGGLDIEAVGKATLDITAATDMTGGFKVITNVPTGMQLYGSIYADAHIEGTTDGTVAGLRAKVSMDNSSAPTSYVYGARITIDEVGANLSGAQLAVLQIESNLDAGGADPIRNYMMRFNCIEGGETPYAWIMAANPSSIAYSANTSYTDGDKVGAIKIHVGGATGVIYLWCYDHPGQ